MRLTATTVELILPRPARGGARAQFRQERLHHDPGAPAQGAPAPPGVDAGADHQLGRHGRHALRRGGAVDHREQAAPGAGIPLLSRAAAADQELRQRARRGRLPPGVASSRPAPTAASSRSSRRSSTPSRWPRTNRRRRPSSTRTCAAAPTTTESRRAFADAP